MVGTDFTVTFKTIVLVSKVLEESQFGNHIIILLNYLNKYILFVTKGHDVY